MVKDHSETRFRHIGYSFRLASRVLLYASSHRQDSTYHGLCYTSRGALAYWKKVIWRQTYCKEPFKQLRKWVFFLGGGADLRLQTRGGGAIRRYRNDFSPITFIVHKSIGGKGCAIGGYSPHSYATAFK